MMRVLMMLVYLWSGLLVVPSLAEEPQGQSPWQSPWAREFREKWEQDRLAPVGGTTWEKARAILDRHEERLSRLPGVRGVDLRESGIVVYTDNPAVVPATIEGLPVSTAPVEEILPRIVQPQETSPTEQDCGPYADWDPQVRRCRRNAVPSPLSSLLPEVPRVPLPPPPGVIVLQPGGKREQADACPEGFKEETQSGWRFCLPPGYAESVPQLWEPPIEGIPYEEAVAILERHRKELWELPGVEGVGLCAKGILVLTDNPEIVPKVVEGLPIVTRPGGKVVPLSHTVGTQIRPLAGSLATIDIILGLGTGGGTLTGISLSQGRPWLIFPAHLLSDCHLNPPCLPGTTPYLNDCQHYGGSRGMIQPPAVPGGPVGPPRRWERIDFRAGLPNSDVAAAYMDKDQMEGNPSLFVEPRIEGFGPFTGRTALANIGTTVRMITSKDTSSAGNHILRLVVVGARMERLVGFDPGQCHDRNAQTRVTIYARYVNQTIYERAEGEVCPAGGDSGSPILDAAGNFIGMINAARTDCQEANGTNADTIKQVLGFDQWYGTDVKNSAIGVYRPSLGTPNKNFFVDNGNGWFEGCDTGTHPQYPDRCFGFREPGHLPITGDWSNSANNGARKIGAYRDGNVYLDLNGNGVYDGCLLNVFDTCTFFGGPGFQPIAGSWFSSTFAGKTKIGVYLNGNVYLDLNANGNYDGCPTSSPQGPDTCTFFGGSGYLPVASNTGVVGNTGVMGVFYPPTGSWYLDTNRSGFFEGCNMPPSPPTKDTCYLNAFGGPGDKPVLGDWNGDGNAADIGVLRNGVWMLDSNGNGTFDGCNRDTCYFNTFGATGDLPFTWNSALVKSN